MKIVEANLSAYRLPYRRHVQWSDTAESSADHVLLELTAEDGRVGIAEMTAKRTWSGVSTRSLVTAVEDLFLPLLRSQAPASESELLDFLQLVPENSAAKCLVGTAVDMILQQPEAATTPLDVPLSWAVTRQAPRDMAKEAASMVERYGFGTLKIKGGQGFETDAQAVAAIRSAVGGGVQLTVDANGAYSARDAREFVDRMASAGAIVVEDPAPLVVDAEFRQLVRDARATVLVDFPCAAAWHAQALLDAGAKMLNVKPGRYGIPEARRIAGLAEAAGAKACIGYFGESALGTLVNLQLPRRNPALISFLPSELSFFLMYEAQVLSIDLEIRNGALRVPPLAQVHGLIDTDRIARYAL